MVAAAITPHDLSAELSAELISKNIIDVGNLGPGNVGENPDGPSTQETPPTESPNNPSAY